jgi:threonine dehydratase
MTKLLKPTLQHIYEARSRIAPHVRLTPLIPVGRRLGLENDFALKCEFLQRTGSFKVRGAASRMLALPADVRRRGVVTMSTGNHGRAVADVARSLGVAVTVCVSKLVPRHKLDLFDGSGARIEIAGESSEQAGVRALELSRAEGLTYVHPFDDPEVIAGQGTIGLELLEQLPGISCLVAGVGGGGLISGIALALKSANPRIRVIGVQMDRNPVMHHSLKAGRPVELEELPTLADSLAGSIGLDNAHTFGMVRDLVDDIVLVSEEQIARAMGQLFRAAHFVLEGAGAAGVAALLAGRITLATDDVVAVVGSGAGISVESFMKSIGGEAYVHA